MKTMNSSGIGNYGVVAYILYRWARYRKPGRINGRLLLTTL